MNHLEEAILQSECSEDCNREDWKKDYLLSAIAHALIAIAQRLDTLLSPVTSDGLPDPNEETVFDRQHRLEMERRGGKWPTV